MIVLQNFALFALPVLVALGGWFYALGLTGRGPFA